MLPAKLMAGPQRDERSYRLLTQIRTFSAALHNHRIEMARQSELNPTDLRALELISRRRGLSAGALADELRLTTGAVTGVIDRLERAGHAVRVADDHDGRRVVIQTTEQARQTARRMLRGLGDAVEAVLADYSPEQVDLFTDFLGRLEEAVRSDAEELFRTTSNQGPRYL